jgi:PAS domain S-box-containing protein
MKKILVVDNDKMFLEFMKDLLSKEGHKMVTAGDGITALDVLENYKPEVIFIDLVMPNIDGSRLCKIIRDRGKLRDVFIIIISGAASADEVDIEGLGADGFIPKADFNDMAQYILAVLAQIEVAPSRYVSRQLMGPKTTQTVGITKELLSAKRHFEIILETMSEGILEITRRGRIVYANPSAVSLFGSSEQNVLASHIAEHFSGDAQKRVVALLNDPHNEDNAITPYYPVSVHESQVSIRLLPIKEGKTLIAILKDVSEGKEDAEVRLKAHRQLKAQVDARTAELTKAKAYLKREMEKRKEAENQVRKLIIDLKSAISNVKHLTQTLSR